MARVRRSNASVDVSDLEDYADRLADSTNRFRRKAPSLMASQQKRLESELQDRIPRSEGARSPASRQYGPLSEAMERVDPFLTDTSVTFGFTFGDAFYWRFLEDGISKMPPHPFIRPSINKVRKPVRESTADLFMWALRR